jgi:hypothetical protein
MTRSFLEQHPETFADVIKAWNAVVVAAAEAGVKVAEG